MVQASFQLEKLTKVSPKMRMATSVVILLGIFALGLFFGILGPSLLQLSKKFDTDIATVSKYFNILIVCGVIGSVPCGMFCNQVNRQLATSAILSLIGLGIIALPFAPTLPVFFAFSAFIGICWIGYEASQIVWIVELWGEKAGSMLQVQFFSFALGTFVGPFMVQIILPTESAPKSTEFGSNTTDTELGKAPLLFIPFAITGSAFILVALFILILYKIKKYEKPAKEIHACENPAQLEKKMEANELDMKTMKSNRIRRIAIIALGALTFGVEWGMELSALQFLPAFGHLIDLHLSESDGASLLSGFALAYTIGRGLGGLIVIKVPVKILLGVNYLLVLIGNLLLVFYANESVPALVGGSICLGVGVSSTSAAFLGYIERRIRLNNVEAAILVGGGNLIMSIYPLVIGTFIEEMPFVLIYANFGSMAAATILYFVVKRLIFVITRK